MSYYVESSIGGTYLLDRMEFLVLQHLLDKLSLVFVCSSLFESFQVFDLFMRGRADSGVKALAGAIGLGKSVDEVE